MPKGIPKNGFNRGWFNKTAKDKELECRVCKKVFTVIKCRGDTAKYCSQKCFHSVSKKSNRNLVNCLYCGAGILKIPSQCKLRNFCNRDCFNKSDYHGMYGKTHSEETKAKMRRFNIDNFSWQKFKSKVKKKSLYVQWRKKVLLRDKNKCLLCNSGEGVEVDHILPLSLILQFFIKKYGTNDVNKNLERCNILWDVSNGRTLCHTCHKDTMTYGNKKCVDADTKIKLYQLFS